MKMLFGKHQGTNVALLPDNYLWWAFGQDFLDNDLAGAVRDEAIRRWPERFSVPIVYPVAATRGATLAAIKIIYREMAVVFHPDHGGNTEAMAALNEFRVRLIQAIG